MFCFDTFGGSFALALCSNAIPLSPHLPFLVSSKKSSKVCIEMLPGVQKGRDALAQILAQPLNQYCERKQVSSSRNFSFLVSEMQMITAHM